MNKSNPLSCGLGDRLRIAQLILFGLPLDDAVSFGVGTFTSKGDCERTQDDP